MSVEIINRNTSRNHCDVGGNIATTWRLSVMTQDLQWQVKILSEKYWLLVKLISIIEPDARWCIQNYTFLIRIIFWKLISLKAFRVQFRYLTGWKLVVLDDNSNKSFYRWLADVSPSPALVERLVWETLTCWMSPASSTRQQGGSLGGPWSVWKRTFSHSW